MIFKEIINEEQKKKVTAEVLKDLPEWFGIAESVDEYIRESAKMTYYACLNEKEYVGFLAINATSECTAEIYVMGIKKKYHRRGLFDMCYKWC